jgi:hypothetical protein
MLPSCARIYGVKMVPGTNFSMSLYSLLLIGLWLFLSGFVVIRNGLTPIQQLEWSTRCLTEYSQAEHTNLYGSIPTIDHFVCV